jgi:Gpi18-like mannosyltransferase
LLGHDLLAAWLVSNVAIIVVFTLLYEQTAKWMDTEAAQKAVVYLALFPTAFFLFAPYSESLFLLFVLLFFLALDREWWAWAGVCAGLAVLTRLQGIVLLLPLVYGWLQSKSFAKSGIMAMALPPAAALIYLVLRSSVAPVFVLPMNEPELSARLVAPWENYLYAITTMLSGRFILPDLLNFLAALLLVIAVVAGWRRLPMSLNLYNVGSLFLLTMRFVDTQPLNSLIRYSLAFFPVFMFLGSVGKNPWVNRVILYVGFALNLYLTAQFVLWGWVG